MSPTIQPHVPHEFGFDPFEQELAAQLEMQDVLVGSVRRCDYYATDATDEFQVTREDGQGDQGIFKVWAAPVIPTLDTGRFDVEEAMTTWRGRMEDSPLSLYESLEQWRSFSAVHDRRLQQIFETRPMPEDPEAATVEHVQRLVIGFAYGAPFYHLEALVADTREERSDNPIDVHAESATAGKLDAVAMLLPAAVQGHVVADELQWNGLNWTALEQQLVAMRAAFEHDPESIDARQFVVVHKIAALANLEPADVLLAANTLQFIPADVGGKREDMPQPQALAALETILDRPADGITTGTVAKDANALIRFLNWTSAIRSDRNFEGKYAMYDSVCRTAADLVDLAIAHPHTIFTDEFAPVFVEQLAPQLQNLDAASAKGRFMLQLLAEGKFKPELSEQILEGMGTFNVDVARALVHIKQDEALVDVGVNAPTALIGGKAVGLQRARQLFGMEHVVGGKVITCEAIGDWLDQIEGLPALVDMLEQAITPEEKVAVGKQITGLIHASNAPAHLIHKVQETFEPGTRVVLRSSSFDEDVDIIGPAPGVYDSVVDIDSHSEALEQELKTVVSSFFSDRAISFRELKGLRHKPLFAVLAQEFQPGIGGSLFIHDGKITLNTAPSPSNINDDPAIYGIEELTFERSQDVSDLRSDRLSTEQLRMLQTFATTAETVHGPSDLEYVIDEATGAVRLLQLRSLERPKRHADSIAQTPPDYIFDVAELGTLPELNGHRNVELRIGADIDLDRFQGSLFRWIIVNQGKIQRITLEHTIPTTSHFANIIESLGINLQFAAAS